MRKTLGDGKTTLFMGQKNQYWENAILSKVIYRSNAILIKSPVIFFTERERNCKIHTEAQKNLGSWSNPEWEELFSLLGDVTLYNFKLYCEAVVEKHRDTGTRTRYVDQWNGMEEPDTSPYSYSHLIFDKNIHLRKGTIFSNIAGKHFKTGIGKYFMNNSLIAQEIEPVIDKWDFMRFKASI